MKATFKQVNDAHALLKAIALIYSNQSIQNIYGEALHILYCALQEVEVEKENELEKQKIIDAFDFGFTDGCRYSTGYEQTQWQEGEIYYEETYKKAK